MIVINLDACHQSFPVGYKEVMKAIVSINNLINEYIMWDYVLGGDKCGAF